LNGNFIEGMACKGGCVNGPVSLFRKPTGTTVINNHANKAKEVSVKGTEEYNIENLNLNI